MDIIPVKWNEYVGKYLVHSNGQIWNIPLNRFLKINYNDGTYDYPKVTLISSEGITKAYNLHTIIAEHFVPKPENLINPEVNHIDMNKLNCDHSNLEWTTHQDNMRKARKEKRWESTREDYEHSLETKKKMSIRKQKKIILYNDDKSLTFNSIDEFTEQLNTHRNTFRRYVNSHKTWRGFYIRYL